MSECPQCVYQKSPAPNTTDTDNTTVTLNTNMGRASKFITSACLSDITKYFLDKTFSINHLMKIYGKFFTVAW